MARPRYPRRDPSDRFWRKVSNAGVRGTCWEWTGFRRKSGHGLTSHLGRPAHAHRVAWLKLRGDIQNGLCVNHKCDNPACCNPEHLYLGTRADNMRDRFAPKSVVRYRVGKSKTPEPDAICIDV